jgi:hypothetical protein
MNLERTIVNLIIKNIDSFKYDRIKETLEKRDLKISIFKNIGRLIIQSNKDSYTIDDIELLRKLELALFDKCDFIGVEEYLMREIQI